MSSKSVFVCFSTQIAKQEFWISYIHICMYSISYVCMHYRFLIRGNLSTIKVYVEARLARLVFDVMSTIFMENLINDVIVSTSAIFWEEDCWYELYLKRNLYHSSSHRIWRILRNMHIPKFRFRTSFASWADADEAAAIESGPNQKEKYMAATTLQRGSHTQNITPNKQTEVSGLPFSTPTRLPDTRTQNSISAIGVSETPTKRTLVVSIVVIIVFVWLLWSVQSLHVKFSGSYLLLTNLALVD